MQIFAPRWLNFHLLKKKKSHLCLNEIIKVLDNKLIAHSGIFMFLLNLGSDDRLFVHCRRLSRHCFNINVES